MKNENSKMSSSTWGCISVFMLGLLAQGAFSTGALAQGDTVCGDIKAKADQSFKQCLSKIKVTTPIKSLQGKVTQCERIHTNAYARAEKKYGVACVGTPNKTEAKAAAFYQVNQQLKAEGVDRVLMATPGTDVLVWAYPAWMDDGQAMQTIFSTAESVYNPKLTSNGYKPLVGMALPVIGYNSSKVLSASDQYCPYAQTSYLQNTYLPGLKSILGTEGIDTVIGIANIGQTDGWKQQSTDSILKCLNNFNGYITGLMIDDEYNQLSTDQRNAMLNWCMTTLPNSNGRCGMVMGHGTTTTAGLVTPRQDICMDYGTTSDPNPNTPSTTCLQQNTGYQRNLYYEGSPKPNTPLPFSIVN